MSSTEKVFAGAGAIAGAAPFAFAMATWSGPSYRDSFALGAGGVAALCGLVALVLALKHGAGGLRVMFAIGVMALGGIQIAKGLGVFAQPPSIGDSTIAHRDIVPPAPEVPDPPEVALAKSCDAGSAQACEEGGEFYDDIKHRDPGKAVALYDEGCKLNHAMACSNLGVDIANTDAPRANQLFARACEMSDGNGCNNLGITFRDGVGVTADSAKALAAFDRGCELHDMPSCRSAAIAYHEGDGTKKNLKRAAQLLETACAANDSHSCYNLGVLAESGEGTKKDLKKARQLYDQACAADDADACNNFGHFLEAGIGGPKDKKHARELFQKACDAKMDLACQNLKTMR